MVRLAESSWRDSVTLAFLDEPPFCFPRLTGEGAGADIEVAVAVLSALPVRLIKTRLVTFAELLPGVAAGHWTINTPLFITAERAERVAFSRPVWALADGLLVRAPDAATLNSYEALAGTRRAVVGVVSGQVQALAAMRAGVPEERMRSYATQRDAVEALRMGAIDAYPSVGMAHRGYLEREMIPGLAVIDLFSHELPGEGRAAAQGTYSFARENDALRLAFDEELTEFLGSTRHRAIMRRFGFDDAEIDRVL